MLNVSLNTTSVVILSPGRTIFLNLAFFFENRKFHEKFQPKYSTELVKHNKNHAICQLISGGVYEKELKKKTRAARPPNRAARPQTMEWGENEAW